MRRVKERSILISLACLMFIWAVIVGLGSGYKVTGVIVGKDFQQGYERLRPWWNLAFLGYARYRVFHVPDSYLFTIDMGGHEETIYVSEKVWREYEVGDYYGGEE